MNVKHFQSLTLAAKLLAAGYWKRWSHKSSIRLWRLNPGEALATARITYLVRLSILSWVMALFRLTFHLGMTLTFSAVCVSLFLKNKESRFPWAALFAISSSTESSAFFSSLVSFMKGIAFAQRKTDDLTVGEVDLTNSIKRELTVRICVPMLAEMSFGTTTEPVFRAVIWAAPAWLDVVELALRLCGRKLKSQLILLKLQWTLDWMIKLPQKNSGRVALFQNDIMINATLIGATSVQK